MTRDHHQSDASTIFSWIGETILQTSIPIILSKIGSVYGLQGNTQAQDPHSDNRDFKGKIDDVLVHPTRDPIDWCAFEVHFSGKAMKQKFKLLGTEKSAEQPFPAAQGCPDWPSSGPERLLHQLQSTVPTIRTWGKKMAVVVDEAFFGSLVELEPEKYLSNSEIAWFVVRYVENPSGWVPTPHKVVFATLIASVKALTGGVPLPRERFEDQLKLKLALKFPGHPFAKQN